MVGMETGMINCYRLREEKGKDPDKILAAPALAWNLKTNGRVRTLPLIAENISFLGSDDGRVFATMTKEPTPLYRVKTGGAIGEELGTYGTRMLLIPSADYNLYAVDVLTTKMLWVFPSGAAITQAPMIVGEDVFVINRAGELSVLDPKTGEPRWTLPTHSGRLLAASGSKIYLRTVDLDLLVVDRARGGVVADPAATLQRAGLDLREFDMSFPNRYDDRMYVGSSSGLVVSLREMGQVAPLPLRKPEAEPFAHVPPEGVKEKPAAPPAEAPADAEPGAEPAAPPDADPAAAPDAASEFK
jgi:outer membrane protein assembly factor BamB